MSVGTAYAEYVIDIFRQIYDILEPSFIGPTLRVSDFAGCGRLTGATILGSRSEGAVVGAEGRDQSAGGY